MRRCLCPGSFDPVTNGHLDVITRAASLFDEVVVAVLVNPAKRATFTAEERVAMVGEALAGAPDAARITVIAPAHGLLAVLARDLGASALVKGVRGGADVEHESSMAQMNRHLGVETVLLLSDPGWAHVSSSLVREVASLGGDVSAYVPAGVAARLAARVDSSVGVTDVADHQRHDTQCHDSQRHAIQRHDHQRQEHRHSDHPAV